MKKKILAVSFILFLGIIFASCQRDKDNLVEPETVDGMKSLNVSSSFDWATTSNYTIKFAPYAGALVKIADGEGNLLKVVMLSNDETTIVDVAVPSYLKKLTVLSLGNEKELELSASEIEFSFHQIEEE